MQRQKDNELDVQKKLVNKYKAISKQEFYRLYQKYWDSVILAPLPKQGHISVLDCGCGTGKMLQTLLNIYNHVYGIDLCIDMLKVIEGYKEKVKVVTGNIQEMGFKNNTFDIVICKGSLHHLTNPEDAIKEIWRVLKKNGLFILSEPCRDNVFWHNVGVAYTKLSRNFSNHHHLFYSNLLKKIIMNNGFTIQRIQYFGFVGFPLCGIAYQLPIMKFIPFNYTLCKILIRLDKSFSKIPLLRRFNWHIIIHSKKI
jgi:ubiquinone/menaquinone biosynthesis C-methylase UbiE